MCSTRTWIFQQHFRHSKSYHSIHQTGEKNVRRKRDWALNSPLNVFFKKNWKTFQKQKRQKICFDNGKQYSHVLFNSWTWILKRRCSAVIKGFKIYAENCYCIIYPWSNSESVWNSADHNQVKIYYYAIHRNKCVDWLVKLLHLVHVMRLSANFKKLWVEKKKILSEVQLLALYSASLFEVAQNF